MTIGTLTRRSSAQVDTDHAQHAGSGPHDGPRCACRHDGTRWQAMCVAAQADWDREHTAAMLSRRSSWSDLP
jgi:hypothetical protein